MQAGVEHKQVNTAFILSIVSGALISIQGVLHVVRARWALELGLGELRRRSLSGIDVKVLGIFTVVLGLMVLLGAFLTLKPQRVREGAITVIAFSVLSIMTGGGYYLAGLILGVVGGALALSQYQQKQSTG